MPSILSLSTISRRQAIAIWAGAAIATVTSAGAALGRQTGGSEYTFVVAGLDYREGFDEHNSDVLMVSRVNLDLGTVRTVSIPRDLYVELPGHGMDKITRAFHHGYYSNGESWDAGAALLSRTITHNFGLMIDGVVTTDFAGFERVIDAVGGVEVDNPYEVEGFGTYPSFPAGQQTLNGEAALVFVRTRTQDGDDGRVMRQQLVLAALLDKLQKPEVVIELPQLIASVRDAVETNIPMSLQLRLIAAVPSISRENVHFRTITDYLVGGIIDNGMWVYQADWSVLPGVVQRYLAGE